MGFFGGYIFDGSSWHDFDPQSGQAPPARPGANEIAGRR